MTNRVSSGCNAVLESELPAFVHMSVRLGFQRSKLEWTFTSVICVRHPSPSCAALGARLARRQIDVPEGVGSHFGSYAGASLLQEIEASL